MSWRGPTDDPRPGDEAGRRDRGAGPAAAIRPSATALRGLTELAAERPLRLRVDGASMAPQVGDGASVEVAPARRYWPGDVIAFRDRDGRLLLHRLIGYRPRKLRRRPFVTLDLVTRGDAAPGADYAVPREAVLGRVGAAPRLRIRSLARFALHVARVGARRLGR